MIQPLETLFLFLLVITSVAALEAADLLSAVILFGAFSFFAATFYAIAGALDVMTSRNKNSVSRGCLSTASSGAPRKSTA